MSSNEELLRELHTGLALVKAAQTEINRRLGLIEASLKEEEDAEDAKRDTWTTWFLQVVGQVVLVTALIWLGRQLGIEVAG